MGRSRDLRMRLALCQKTPTATRRDVHNLIIFAADSVDRRILMSVANAKHTVLNPVRLFFFFLLSISAITDQ